MDEIASFFTGVEKVIFSEPESKNDHLKAVPIIWLILHKKKFDHFRRPGRLTKLMEGFGEPAEIHFKIFYENRQPSRVSVFEQCNNVEIPLQNAMIDTSVGEFIKLTEKNDKIFLLIAGHENGEIVFDEEKFRNLVLILDGYEIDGE
jgi:hypothetical protein